jgi:dolichol-phosphate mannosyltransferase
MPITIIREAVFQDCPKGPFRVATGSVAGRVSIIVPTFQEAQNIGPFLSELCQVLDRAAPDHEVLVVDDDSADETWRHASEFAEAFPAVRVIRRKGESGLASAVIRGYQAASGEILGTINADFQHPTEVLGAMIERIREADLVVASRFCEGGGTGDWAKDRLLMSRAAFQAGRLLLPNVFSDLTDPLSGFYLFRRKVIEGVTFQPVGFKTLIEILARGNVRNAVECPYQMQSRQRGKSKAKLQTFLSFLNQLQRLQTMNES